MITKTGYTLISSLILISFLSSFTSYCSMMQLYLELIIKGLGT
jgi:hypothetical protein